MYLNCYYELFLFHFEKYQQKLFTENVLFLPMFTVVKFYAYYRKTLLALYFKKFTYIYGIVKLTK